MDISEQKISEPTVTGHKSVDLSLLRSLSVQDTGQFRHTVAASGPIDLPNMDLVPPPPADEIPPEPIVVHRKAPINSLKMLRRLEKDLDDEDKFISQLTPREGFMMMKGLFEPDERKAMRAGGWQSLLEINPSPLLAVYAFFDLKYRRKRRTNDDFMLFGDLCDVLSGNEHIEHEFPFKTEKLNLGDDEISEFSHIQVFDSLLGFIPDKEYLCKGFSALIDMTYRNFEVIKELDDACLLFFLRLVLGLYYTDADITASCVSLLSNMMTVDGITDHFGAFGVHRLIGTLFHTHMQSSDVCRHLLMLIVNACSDSKRIRVLLHGENASDYIIEAIASHESPQVLEYGVWALRNICAENPLILEQFVDGDILSLLLDVLEHHSRGPVTVIAQICDTNVALAIDSAKYKSNLSRHPLLVPILVKVVTSFVSNNIIMEKLLFMLFNIVYKLDNADLLSRLASSGIITKLKKGKEGFNAKTLRLYEIIRRIIIRHDTTSTNLFE
ncbi:hypothetical protein PCE1_002790 [Barthelona sp. PCE]